MNHFKSEFNKNFKMYSNLWWKHVLEDVEAHANNDHHRLLLTYLIVRSNSIK